MPRKEPLPCKLKLVVGNEVREVSGWESGLAMGIVASERGFASVMLMPGLILEDKFDSIADAHAFNLAAIAHKDLFVGTPFLDEFFERAGGADKAKATIAKIRGQLQAA